MYSKLQYNNEMHNKCRLQYIYCLTITRNMTNDHIYCRLGKQLLEKTTLFARRE